MGLTKTNSNVRLLLETISWKEFACGMGAAFINIVITYPIQKTIFRQMMDGRTTSRAVHQLRLEGVRFLYRGIGPPLTQKAISSSIMFGMYDEVLRPMSKTGYNLYLSKTIAANVAGCIEAILMPLERIQTLLSHSAYHDKFKNTYHAFREVGLKYGMKEYYRGLVPILLRNGPSNVGFFIIRDEVNQRLPKHTSKVQQTINQFISGAFIGAGLSTIMYPLNVTKIVMQTKLGGPFQNMFTVLRQTYIERGRKIRYIYRGVHLNLSRSFLSWGIINAAYEALKHVLYNADLRN